MNETETELTDDVVAALLNNADGKVRCQGMPECPIHGLEPCEQRARWSARFIYFEEPAATVVVCDRCHDAIEGSLADPQIDYVDFNGHKLLSATWREL